MDLLDSFGEECSFVDPISNFDEMMNKVKFYKGEANSVNFVVNDEDSMKECDYHELIKDITNEIDDIHVIVDDSKIFAEESTNLDNSDNSIFDSGDNNVEPSLSFEDMEYLIGNDNDGNLI